jgi:hypothetical protein
MLKRIGWIILGIAAAAAIIVGVRWYTDDIDAFMRHEADAFQQRTIPPEAKAIHISSIVRSQWATEESWEFQTGMKWVDYSEWVGKQLCSDHRVITATTSTFEFSKQLPGDIEFVRIEQVRDGLQLRVRVTFRIQAD